MDLSRLKFPLLVLAAGFLIGLLGDLMLYDQPLGISIPILALLLVIGLLGLSVVEDVQVVKANLWLIVPILALAGFSAIRAEPALRFLNISGALVLGMLLANRMANRPILDLNLGQYAIALIESTLGTLVLPLPLGVRAINHVPSDSTGERRRSLRGVVIGLLIALPFLAIFTALFASADQIFNNIVTNFFDVFELPDLGGHIVLTLFLSWLAVGGLAYGLTRLPGVASLRIETDAAAPGADKPVEADAAVQPISKPFSIRTMLGTLESSVVLFSIDALFVLFVGIQFAALFGGEAFLRSQDLTYSDYARRGFFELLTVSLITLGLILTLDFITRRETPRQHATFLIGSGLMIGMSILILASAFQRMELYEVAYGFTRLRIYPHVFMVWLAILFALFLGTLILRKVSWFATASLVVAIGFVITMNILNPDAFIVQQNVARGLVGKKVDAAYLGSLSEDAIPEVLPLLDDPRYRDDIGPWLKYRFFELEDRRQHARWASWHWGINRAYELLEARRSDLTKYDASARRYTPGN